MTIPIELKGLIEKRLGDLENEIIEAYLKDPTVETIVKVADRMLREGDSTED